MLEAKGLFKQYKDKHGKVFQAVSDMHVRVDAAEILAFLGPNGAGKTTTIKMIAGLIVPDEGDVWVNGYSMAKQRKHAIRHIGAVLEGSRNLYWRLNPLENCEYWGSLKGVPRKVARQRGRELLCEFGLEDKLDTTVRKLSRGMQQKVAICSALIHKPSLLLLDEPTLGLDLEAAERIKTLITERVQREGTAVLLTTHQMDLAQVLSDRVAIVQKGHLMLEGRTGELLKQFNQNVYAFTLAEALADETRNLLVERGAIFNDDKTFSIVCQEKEQIYNILHDVDPANVLRLESGVDLATVFKHATGMENMNERSEVVINSVVRDAMPSL